MVLKRGKPSEGEIVLGKVIKINPNSIFVKLLEYDAEGMIHISEVSSGWIRDIRHFVKPDQEIVTKVMRSDPLSLSIKRVNDKQAQQKLKSHRLEQRAEKMLELAAFALGKSLVQAYEEIGWSLQERLGSLYEAFKMAIQRPEQLKKYISDDKWLNAIRDVAEKSIELKEFSLRAKLFLKSYSPEGLNVIKNVLSKAKKSKLEVRYIAAPEYLIHYKTTDPKKGKKEFEEKINRLIRNSENIEIKFEMIE